MAWFTEVDLEDLAGGRRPKRSRSIFRSSRRPWHQTNTMGYERAADLLVTLRGVFARAGRDFEAEVGRLKAVHSRKRNFLGALRRRGL